MNIILYYFGASQVVLNVTFSLLNWMMDGSVLWIFHKSSIFSSIVLSSQLWLINFMDFGCLFLSCCLTIDFSFNSHFFFGKIFFWYFFLPVCYGLPHLNHIIHSLPNSFFYHYRTDQGRSKFFALLCYDVWPVSPAARWKWFKKLKEKRGTVPQCGVKALICNQKAIYSSIYSYC